MKHKKATCPNCGRTVDVDENGEFLCHRKKIMGKKVVCSNHRKLKSKKRLWPAKGGLILIDN
jgi:C4-type Zn-finger protein